MLRSRLLLSVRVTVNEKENTVSAKPNVLFLCTHNSARSQLAEGLLRHLAGDRVNVYSAGVEPGTINPLAVRALNEVGIDASDQYAKGVKEYLAKLLVHHLVIVCGGAAEKCPSIWPGLIERHVWPFDDPSSVEGDEAVRLQAFRDARDAIRAKLESELSVLTSIPDHLPKQGATL